MASHAELSTAAMLPRDGDEWSNALRSGQGLGIDDILCLHRTTMPSNDDMSSCDSSSATVFSGSEASTVTKPTSAGTSHPAAFYKTKGKGKQKLHYASSLEGAYGSASEAEAIRKALCRDSVAAASNWADQELQSTRLKGSSKERIRQNNHYPGKHKKHVVVIQGTRRRVEHEERAALMATPTASYSGTATVAPHLHGPDLDEHTVGLAEEGQHVTTVLSELQDKSLSRMRVNVLRGIMVVTALTLLLTAYGVHLMGKSRMPCTRCVVFLGTVAMTCFTVIAMLIARRALSEALLAGLIALVFGFTLLAELKDFM
ncbi:hypothetical protein EK21DRAFT_116474 [Setomelanomma holmii]|uniref:Transmembrane protein n=1 Tax=Setomelanomma holmii TaxID=210430 RepID=A0A9P4GZM6_9PLEO|nr:hypothetical protein EK21DRAFT_116474 [Setomelanomma holmii]